MVQTDVARALIPRFAAMQAHIPSPQITTARMRALLALADTGSYAGAAQATGLSLPTLHRAVQDLALSLRRQLVVRQGKAIALTEAGRGLVRSLRLARLEMETALAELAAMRGVETRQLVIGAMPLSRARVLPAAVARFVRRHPQVRLRIVEGSRDELIEPLRNGAVDLMVGALRLPLQEPDLAQGELFRDRPAVYARCGHPLAEREPSLEEQAAYPWIVPQPGAPLRMAWEEMFARAGLEQPPILVESGSVMTIRQILIDSDALTFLSPDQVAVELEAKWLTLIAPAPDGLERVIGVTTRSSWMPTTVQRDFIAELEAVTGTVGA